MITPFTDSATAYSRAARAYLSKKRESFLGVVSVRLVSALSAGGGPSTAAAMETALLVADRVGFRAEKRDKICQSSTRTGSVQSSMERHRWGAQISSVSLWPCLNDVRENRVFVNALNRLDGLPLWCLRCRHREQQTDESDACVVLVCPLGQHGDG